MTSTWILTLHCPDRPGIVHAVTAALLTVSANITEAQQFCDTASGRFFMRVCFTCEAGPPDALLGDTVTQLAARFDMQWQLHDSKHKARLLLLVSRQGHCLNDLLFRTQSGQLNANIVAVAGNHDDHRALVEQRDIPFHHLPVSQDNRAEQETAILQLVEKEQIDLVVLARYMQILSPALCQQLAGRAINIHHSFLPGFKGGRPYHQAHERGVKIIGATAHYVTEDLDEGPIIEQGVMHVDHTQTPKDLEHIGSDIECTVLARAVRLYVEHRLLLSGKRTIVFR